MSTNFPTSIDSLPNPIGTDLMENATAALDHDVQHANANDAIEAIQAKVGVNSSAVTTSHDYKLSAVTGSAKALASGTSSQFVTGLTLTSPVLNVGSDATGDTYYRNSEGSLVRLPIGTNGQVVAVGVSGIPEYVTIASNQDASTTVKGVVEIATTAEIIAGTSTGATGAVLVVPASAVGAVGASKIVQFNSSSQYPAADGSLITNIANPATYSSGITTYNLTTATGTQTITHGLATTPKYVRATYIINTTSQAAVPVDYSGTGTFNGTTYAVTYVGTSAGDSAGHYATYQSSAAFIIYERGGGGTPVSQTATVTLNSTNIVLNWTKVNSPTGTLNIMWEAFA